MKALNLFTLCNAIGNANFDLYEKQLSHREEIIKHKDYELDTLAKLTNKLLQKPDEKDVMVKMVMNLLSLS